MREAQKSGRHSKPQYHLTESTFTTDEFFAIFLVNINCQGCKVLPRKTNLRRFQIHLFLFAWIKSVTLFCFTKYSGKRDFVREGFQCKLQEICVQETKFTR